VFASLRPLTAAPLGTAVEDTIWRRRAKRFCRELNRVLFVRRRRLAQMVVPLMPRNRATHRPQSGKLCQQPSGTTFPGLQSRAVAV
jgi:hypothetical protein